MLVKKENDFDTVAPYYNFLSRVVFGNTLMKAQCYFLDTIPDNATVLIIGGGDGLFLKRVVAAKPFATIIYVERSEEMIALAKKRVKDSNVTYINASWNELPDAIRCDVIITNFFLDLFPEEECADLIDRISQRMCENWMWLVTDFVYPTCWFDKLLLWIMYKFFNLVSNVQIETLPNWIACFNSKFSESQYQTFRNKFIRSSVFKINHH
jgi:tRNA (cmo5U34)-methyltransferase